MDDSLGNTSLERDNGGAVISYEGAAFTVDDLQKGVDFKEYGIVVKNGIALRGYEHPLATKNVMLPNRVL